MNRIRSGLAGKDLQDTFLLYVQSVILMGLLCALVSRFVGFEQTIRLVPVVAVAVVAAQYFIAFRLSAITRRFAESWVSTSDRIVMWLISPRIHRHSDLMLQHLEALDREFDAAAPDSIVRQICDGQFDLFRVFTKRFVYYAAIVEGIAIVALMGSLGAVTQTLPRFLDIAWLGVILPILAMYGVFTLDEIVVSILRVVRLFRRAWRRDRYQLSGKIETSAP